MINELSKIKLCFKEINKKLFFFNFCINNIYFCCLEISIVLIMWLSFNNFFMFIITLIIFSVLIFFHVKKFREEIFNNENFEKIEGYNDYWIDFKYQALKECLLKEFHRDELILKIKNYINLLEEEYSSKHISIVEKNPIFSISFAIFIAILNNSGVFNNDKNIGFIAFFFLLSVFGMIFSIIAHPVISFNNEKQLIYLLKLLSKELEN